MSDAAPHVDAPNPDADVEIEDPEDYSTSTRLQQIFEARRELREIRRDAAAYRQSSSSSAAKMEAAQYYRSGVESYLLEVDTLLRHHEPGPELWSSKHYGSVTIQPPGKWKSEGGSYKECSNRKDLPQKITELPKPKRFDIVGLESLFQSDSTITATFKFPVDGYTIGEVETAPANGYISWTTLNRMVSDVNLFLGDLGIGLSLDETQEWNI